MRGNVRYVAKNAASGTMIGISIASIAITSWWRVYRGRENICGNVLTVRGMLYSIDGMFGKRRGSNVFAQNRLTARTDVDEIVRTVFYLSEC